MSIIRPDCIIWVIDCKAHLRGAFATQHATGKPVKWFTLSTNRSSYVFNPLDQLVYLPRSILKAAYWSGAFNIDAGLTTGISSSRWPR